MSYKELRNVLYKNFGMFYNGSTQPSCFRRYAEYNFEQAYYSYTLFTEHNIKN